MESPLLPILAINCVNNFENKNDKYKNNMYCPIEIQKKYADDIGRYFLTWSGTEKQKINYYLA